MDTSWPIMSTLVERGDRRSVDTSTTQQRRHDCRPGPLSTIGDPNHQVTIIREAYKIDGLCPVLHDQLRHISDQCCDVISTCHRSTWREKGLRPAPPLLLLLQFFGRNSDPARKHQPDPSVALPSSIHPNRRCKWRVSPRAYPSSSAPTRSRYTPRAGSRDGFAQHTAGQECSGH